MRPLAYAVIVPQIVLMVACATARQEQEPRLGTTETTSSGQPIALALRPYMKTPLRTVTVSIGGREFPFLFDTGSGLTVISDEVAKLIGCEPFGRLTGIG